MYKPLISCCFQWRRCRERWTRSNFRVNDQETGTAVKQFYRSEEIKLFIHVNTGIDSNLAHGRFHACVWQAFACHLAGF